MEGNVKKKYQYKCKWDDIDIVLENMKGFVRKGNEGEGEDEIDRLFRLAQPKSQKPTCTDKPASRLVRKER